MADITRYAKTQAGVDEISQRRTNLRGKLRTMLILIDPTKTADELREQGVRVGGTTGDEHTRRTRWRRGAAG